MKNGDPDHDFWEGWFSAMGWIVWGLLLVAASFGIAALWR